MVTPPIEQISEDIVETIHEPLLVLDSDLKVIIANKRFIDSFKVTREETLGNFIYDLGNRLCFQRNWYCRERKTGYYNFGCAAAGYARSRSG
jgi:PAS domain-containing protein